MDLWLKRDTGKSQTKAKSCDIRKDRGVENSD